MNLRLLPLIATWSCLALFAEAQTTLPNPVDYEQLLVPLAPHDVAGANGSRWNYSFTVLNAGETPLIGYFYPIAADVPPPDIFPAWTGCVFPACPESLLLQPGNVHSQTLGGFDAYGQFGLLLSVRKSSAQSFRYELRVKDESRSSKSAGVAIPVVPFTDFTMQTVHLLNVPVDPRFRHTLRVYAPRRDVATGVRIRMIDQGSRAVLLDGLYHLAQPPRVLPDLYPGFAMHPDVLQVSDLSIPAPVYGGVRFEISSTSAGTPIWAFLSITNNETQEFTVVTPFRVAQQSD